MTFDQMTPPQMPTAASRPIARRVLVRITPRRSRSQGTACAGETAPADPCSGANAAVQAINLKTSATRLRILAPDGTILRTLFHDAVTPTMIAFLMPFDCFADLTLEVAKHDPDDNRLTVRVPLLQSSAR